ncbi:MAG: anthranilate synthase component I family protein [Oscillospiraceae bacterium]|nr:anthranilate synthase component I family protein [Oscillospiraceae bacterium]
MIRPTLAQAKAAAQHHSIVPIALEIFSDTKTPMEILRQMRRQSDDWFILESVNGGDSWGRYTFLGYKPVQQLCNGGIEDVRVLLKKYHSARVKDLPPFTGGFVGYFAYDFVQQLIPGLQLHAKNDEDFADFHLMRIDKVVAFDHFKQKIYLIVNVPAQDIESSYIAGVETLKDMERALMVQADNTNEQSHCGEFTALHSKAQFHAMIEKVQHHIKEGDIFQAVVSNRFTAPFSGSLLNTYRLLRTINPSPYMCHMRLGGLEIACASPETLVSLQEGKLSSFPLAGTCKRGATPEEDAALIDALLSNEKELAEHDMLVDLARNDLGRVAQFGSVQVQDYRAVKKFSHVSHISSHVVGKLKPDCDPIDVLAATLPAGTLSGAPKKRACEIIDDCEGHKRGAYGGALGYIDFTGNMDMCIGIRMAVLKDGKVHVQAGAGVVAQSTPDAEYAEVQNKAFAMMLALQGAQNL